MLSGQPALETQRGGISQMIGLDHVMPADSAAAYFTLHMKAPSSQPVNTPPDSAADDLDGCCVQVEMPTPDEELPAAEGGVA